IYTHIPTEDPATEEITTSDLPSEYSPPANEQDNDPAAARSIPGLSNPGDKQAQPIPRLLPGDSTAHPQAGPNQASEGDTAPKPSAENSTPVSENVKKEPQDE
ncbi:MAG: hypothetical protein GY934_09970, partial [Gammaproteobacteria bacterium]|nr:hypothetical protein [Gammaproteobacteria bacterium]